MLFIHLITGLAERNLTLALLIALLVHMVMIFLVRFDLPISNPISQPALEVILVNRRNPTPVKDAEYLAQIHQQGGGKNRNTARTTHIPITSTQIPDHPITTTPTPSRAMMTDVHHELLLVPKVAPVSPDIEKNQHSAIELVASGMEIAHLAAESQPDFQSNSGHLRSKYISASTREYKYAAYMDAWRIKVERIGKFNYPTDAQHREIYGSLILDVALDANGEVGDISVVHSSGHKLLDDAAIRIVKLSAPFAKFPPDIRQDTDVLHITRTWQFRGGGISSKP